MSRDPKRKIVGRERLLQMIDRARDRGESIVQCHGCFDIVHPGHIRYLEFAKRQGDVLLVSLTGDAGVNKGAQRPYIPQELRAESLAALECVDLVYVNPQPTAEDILTDVRPDVYVKGQEYEGSDDPRFLAERQAVEGRGGRVIFSSGEVVFSSTKLIESMSPRHDLDSQRLKIFCERHGMTRVTLDEVVESFAGLRVLVVGDTVVDRYIFCDALDVASESPMLSLKRLDEQCYIGGAAIVARHAAALGAQTFLLSAGATDDQTRWMETILEDEHVDTVVLRCRPGLVEKIRYLVDDKKLLKVETGDRVPLDSLAERRAMRILEEQAAIADVAIFCDFGYGMLSEKFVKQVMARLRSRLRVITADVSGPRASLLSFHHADLLCPTEREMRSHLHDYDRGLSSTAYSLLQHTQACHLFVTLEKKGMVVFDRTTDTPDAPGWSDRLLSEHLPSFADHVIDRLGAGDALLAGASLSLAAGATLTQAAYLGNAAAALEIARLGNSPIHALNLRSWLGTRPELTPGRLSPAIASVV